MSVLHHAECDPADALRSLGIKSLSPEEMVALATEGAVQLSVHAAHPNTVDVYIPGHPPTRRFECVGQAWVEKKEEKA